MSLPLIVSEVFFLYNSELFVKIEENENSILTRKIVLNLKESLKQNKVCYKTYYADSYDRKNSISTESYLPKDAKPFDIVSFLNNEKSKQEQNLLIKEKKAKDKQFYGIFRTLVKSNDYSSCMEILKESYPEFFINNICLHPKVQNAKGNN